MLTFLRPELESKRIEIRTSYGTLPLCRLDENLFKQVLLNLLINAEQAVDGRDQREVMVRTSQENDAVRVDVIDTGEGIPPEKIGKVFEPFQTTKASGTGLGLATARRIVEEHGGRISVVSELGRGSWFTVLLPIKPPEGRAPAGKPAAEASGRVKGL